MRSWSTAGPSHSPRPRDHLHEPSGQGLRHPALNPFNVRVAVALSVDGLNSIDARRTSATDARKWVLDPHESLVISGWQVDMNHARKFFFTTEQDSYAQWLGKTQNTGVVTAVFFRERVARIEPIAIPPAEPLRDRAGAAQGAAGAPSGAAGKDSARSAARNLLFDVNQAAIARITRPRDWRPDRPCRSRIRVDPNRPASTVSVRYEFRSQLVRLGCRRPPPIAEPPRRRGFGRFAAAANQTLVVAGQGPGTVGSG
jgi:hypothetical protein